MSRIAIIGGGISGLSTAHFLKHYPWSTTTTAHLKNLNYPKEIHLFESNEHFGGWIKTTHKKINILNNNNNNNNNYNYNNYNIHFEHGPNSIRGGLSPQSLITWDMINNIQLQNYCLKANENISNKRYIYYHNQLFLLSWTQVIYDLLLSIFPRLLTRWWQLNKGSQEDESLYNFCQRHFGTLFTQKYISAFVNGIYGGGIHHLSAQYAMPFGQLKQLENKFGWILTHLLWNRNQYNDMIKEQEKWLPKHILERRIEARKNLQNQDQISSDDIQSSSFKHMELLPPRSSYTFKEGMEMLITHLVQDLKTCDWIHLHKNSEITKLQFPTLNNNNNNNSNNNNNNTNQILLHWKDEPHTQKIQEFDHVFVCVSPKYLLPLISHSIDKSHLSSFPQNNSASIVVVTMIWYNVPAAILNSNKFDGFGVLCSEAGEDSLLGIIYHSSTFPQLNNNDKEGQELRLVFMFEKNTKNIKNESFWKDEHLIELTQKKLCEIHHLKKEDFPSKSVIVNDTTTDIYADETIPLLYHIDHLSNCIEHYTIGHQQKIKYLQDEILNKQWVTLVGGGYYGVGIPNNVFSAYKQVQEYIHKLNCHIQPEQTNNNTAKAK